MESPIYLVEPFNEAYQHLDQARRRRDQALKDGWSVAVTRRIGPVAIGEPYPWCKPPKVGWALMTCLSPPEADAERLRVIAKVCDFTHYVSPGRGRHAGIVLECDGFRSIPLVFKGDTKMSPLEIADLLLSTIETNHFWSRREVGL